MKLLKNIGLAILIGGIIFFLWDKFTQKKEVIEVPVKIEVPVPSQSGSSDTLSINKYKTQIKYLDSLNSLITRNNKELIVKNTELSEKNQNLIKENGDLIEDFKIATDSIKDKMYKEAIAIREYNKTFEDSIQTVSIYSKTRGTLLEQSIEYEVKPYTIPLDTTVTTEVKGKFKVFGLLEGGTNLLNGTNDFVGKGTVILKNSKDNGISIGIDTRKYVYLGYLFKF